MVILILLLIVILYPVKALANTGPVTWYEYPDISLMTIDENTSIVVEKEDLHFDFSEDISTGFSMVGKVSAKYFMKNTEAKDIVAPMVFPMIQNIWAREDAHIEVLVNGEPQSYEVFYGKNADETNHNDKELVEEKVELKDILEAVTSKPYEPINFSYNDIGTLYRIHFDSKEDMNVEAKFTLNRAGSKILSKGNNSYGYTEDTNEIMVGTSINWENQTMEVFSLNEEINLEIIGFNYDNSKVEVVDDFAYEIEEVKIELLEYYWGFLKPDESNYNSSSWPEDQDLYYEALDQALERNRVVTKDDIEAYLSSPRYILLSYDVPFEALDEKTLEVRYHTLGSMDQTKTLEPTYTYDYFLHPAKCWKDFKDLTIKITPSKTYPFILNSNLELIKENDGSYVGKFETLPNEDLSFTLYSKEKVTTIERIKRFISRNFYYFGFIGGSFLKFLGIVSVISLVVYGTLKMKKKQQGLK